jgi:hypothetical protein
MMSIFQQTLFDNMDTKPTVVFVVKFLKAHIDEYSMCLFQIDKFIL